MMKSNERAFKTFFLHKSIYGQSIN